MVEPECIRKCTKIIGEKKKNLLIQAKRDAMISGSNLRVRSLKSKINILLDKEAQMWCQQSQVLWLKHRDNNTKFFHSQATQRHRKNLIRGINDCTNTWKVQPDEIANVLLSYYQELFTIANSTPSNATLDLVPHVITSEMNSMLTANFLECEVELALKQMARLKALGLDGMPLLFYQHFWLVVHHDVIGLVLS